MKTLTKTLSLLALSLLASLSLSAAPIKLYPVGDGVGLSTSLDDATLIPWLGNQITYYNTYNDPDLPTLPLSKIAADVSMNVDNGGKSVELDLTGHTYLILHWGNDNTYGYKNLEAFYVKGETTGIFDSPIWDDKSYGLSFYRFYDVGGDDVPGVPDNGSTLILLGLSTLALATIARRR